MTLGNVIFAALVAPLIFEFLIPIQTVLMFPHSRGRVSLTKDNVFRYYRENWTSKVLVWFALGGAFVWSILVQHWMLYLVAAALIVYSSFVYVQLSRHLRSAGVGR